MLKFLKRKKKDTPPQSQQSQRPPTDDSDEEFEDDEAIEAMHAQQEDYLLHLALASSAKEYQRANGTSRKAHQSFSNRAGALSYKYWSTGM